MNNFKLWILAVIGMTAVIYSAIAAIIDPLGVFGDKLFNMQKISMLTNQRFHKIEYLEKNFRQYNSYLIGGSRTAAINPEWIEKYIPGSKFYNLFVSAATEYDNLNHVRYVLENYIVRNIVVQVHMNDLYSYFDLGDSTLTTTPHYKVSGENILQFYLPYLSPGGELLAKKLKYALGIHKTDNLKTVVEETGERSYRYEEKLITEDHEKYMANEKTFHIQNEKAKLKLLTKVARETSDTTKLFAQKGKAWGIKLKENIASLQEIRRICDEKKVRLILLTMPHNQEMMDIFDAEDYLAFIRELSGVAPFWDFSGYNSITTDNRNYYEWSHYRITVVKYILARMFADPSVDVPEDFGVFVTHENIEEHIVHLRGNILSHRENAGLPK